MSLAPPPTQAPPLVTLMTGAQTDFMLCAAYHPAIFAGRRSGKTVASVTKAFNYCLSYPGALGVMTAPSYTKVRDILVPAFHQLFGALKGAGPQWGWEYHKGDMEIEFGNGSKVLLRSAENAEFGRGLTLAFFAMDEAGEPTNNGSQEEVFLLLQPTLTQKGFPHQGWVTTTPKGPNHWLYRRWVKHETSAQEPLSPEDYPFFFMETERNFHLQKDTLRVLRESYGNSRWAEQELLGRFVAMEGLVFPEFDRERHVSVQDRPTEFNRVLAGLDWGLSSPTAMVKIGVGPDRRPYVLDEFYERNASIEDVAARLREWGAARVFCDPTARETIEQLRRLGFFASKARSNHIKDRVHAIRQFLEGERVLAIDPQCINLIEEITSLEYARAPGGNERTNDRFNPSMPDHACDSLAYSLMDLGHFYGEPPQFKVLY